TSPAFNAGTNASCASTDQRGVSRPQGVNCDIGAYEVGGVAPTLSTSATPTAAFGTPISDTATLSGGNSPTGTLTFFLFGPTDPNCASPPVFTSAPVAVNGNGAYSSGNFTPLTAGTYRWRANYSGDGSNNPVAGNCTEQSEISVVTQAAPTITT